MKGVTQLIRDLEIGEQIEVVGTARDNIYRIARENGIKVKVEKFVGGFYVTRISEPQGPKSVMVTVVQPTGDALADFIAKAQAKKGIAPIEVEPESVDEWQGWSEEQTKHDSRTDEIVTFRQHHKTRQVREIRRESNLSGA